MPNIDISTSNLKKTLEQLNFLFNVDTSKLAVRLVEHTLEFYNVSGKKISRDIFDPRNQEHKLTQKAVVSISNDNAAKKFKIRLAAHPEQAIFDIDAIIESTHDTKHDARTFKKDLHDAINIKKLYYGIPIGLFDIEQHSAVDSIFNFISANDFKLNKQTRIPVVRAVRPITFLQPEIKFLAEKICKDYKIIIKAEKDKPILQIIQGINGAYGRSATGQIVPTTIFDSIPYLQIDFTDSFYELQGVIYSKGNGHAIFFEQENKLTFDTSVDYEKITCREIGQNLDLSYSCLRAGTKEADGSIENCNIQADEVCTQQGIFACNITANRVEIGGSTSNLTKIATDKAKIKIIKGFVVSKTVEAESIDTGAKIKAITVLADTCIGANIEADIIQIQELHSRTTLSAKKTININKVTGNENSFFIHGGLTEAEQKREDEIKKTILNLTKKTESLNTIIKNLKTYIKNNQNSFNDLVARQERYNNENDRKIISGFESKRDQLTRAQKDVKDISQDLARAIDSLNIIRSEKYAANINVASGLDLSQNKVAFVFDGKSYYAPRKGTFKSIAFDVNSKSITTNE